MEDNRKLDFKAASGQLEIEGIEFSLSELVQKVKDYKYKDNCVLYKVMNGDYIAGMLDREKLQQIQKELIDNQKEFLTIIEFVKIMLRFIQHNEEETLYLTLGLVEFFKGISESLNIASKIKFTDITNAVCTRIGHTFDDEEHQIRTRQQLPQKHFPDKTNSSGNVLSSHLTLKSPLIFENNQHACLKRLHKGKFKTDSTFHDGRKIKNAVYAKEIKRVITLDSLDKKISMYDLNCQLISQIEVKCKDDDTKLEVIAFGIAWSERQQRIGAVLKNYSMSFWDVSSDFSFEKNFSVHGYTQDYQSSIWYLENQDMWITTDFSNSLYVWDIANETTTSCLSTPLITAGVFNIVELPKLELTAIGSLDKKISFCDFLRMNVLFQIESTQVGVHSMAYSNGFEILVTAGYENTISLYSIDKQELDYTLLGKLRGHTSMISCVQTLEGTPMVISADDQGQIRLWDIRNQGCIQTFQCSSSQLPGNSLAKKVQISLILDLYSDGMVGLIGNRLNLVCFDEKEEIVKEKSSIQRQYALKVQVSQQQDELIVCCNHELKFYDLSTGRLKYSVTGILDNDTDEITVFQQSQQGQYYLLGNSRGQISLHSEETKGKKVKNLCGHGNDVTQLKIDYTNKLLISGGCDSTINIQTLNDNNVELKRTIHHTHNDKPISILEVSVYHNVIFSAAMDSEIILVFDYEYGKLLSYIEFSQHIEPTAMCCLQGLPVLIVSTNDNLIYITCFSKKNNQISFDLLTTIHLNQNAEDIQNHCSLPQSFFLTKPPVKENQSKPNRRNADTNIESHVAKYKSKTPLMSQLSPISRIHHLDSKIASSFEDIGNEKDRINNTGTKIHENINNEEEERILTSFITKFLPDFAFDSNNQLQKARLFCATSKGFIIQFDLAELFKRNSKIPFLAHASTRLNYNAQRNSSEDCRQAISKFSGQPAKFTETTPACNKYEEQIVDRSSLYSSDVTMVHNIQAHKEQMTSFSFLTTVSSHILTSSLDQYVKIWDKNTLEQICSLNINHPLPIQWKYISDESHKAAPKVLYALRILDIITKESKTEYDQTRQNQTKIIHFLKKLMKKQPEIPAIIPKENNQLQTIQEDQERQTNPNQPAGKISSRRLTLTEKKKNESSKDDKDIQDDSDNGPLQDSTQKKNKVLLMGEFYSPRDIQFEKVKHFYKSELLGMSLKRMEVNKRVAIAQQIWKKPAMTREEIERERARKTLEQRIKGDERETIANFLDPNYRNFVLYKGLQFDDDLSIPTQTLQMRLEYFSQANNPRKTAGTQGTTTQQVHSAQPKQNRQQHVQSSSQLIQTQQQHPQNKQASRLSFKTDYSSSDNKIALNQQSSNSIMEPIKNKQVSKALIHKTPVQGEQPTQQNLQGLKKSMTQIGFGNNNNNDTSSNNNKLKHQGSITLGADQIKEQKKEIHSQTCHLQQPANFDILIGRAQGSTMKPSKNLFSFPELQEMKLNAEAFPETAAMVKKRQPGNDIKEQATSTYGFSESKYGQNTSNKNSIDVYTYAENKNIISPHNVSKSENVKCQSQIMSASSNKLHSILNALNTKLTKSKAINHSTTNKSMASTAGLIDQGSQRQLQQNNSTFRSSTRSSRNTLYDITQSTYHPPQIGYIPQNFSTMSQQQSKDSTQYQSQQFSNNLASTQNKDYFQQRYGGNNRYSLPSLGQQNKSNQQ